MQLLCKRRQEVRSCRYLPDCRGTNQLAHDARQSSSVMRPTSIRLCSRRILTTRLYATVLTQSCIIGQRTTSTPMRLPSGDGLPRTCLRSQCCSQPLVCLVPFQSISGSAELVMLHVAGVKHATPVLQMLRLCAAGHWVQVADLGPNSALQAPRKTSSAVKETICSFSTNSTFGHPKLLRRRLRTSYISFSAC